MTKKSKAAEAKTADKPDEPKKKKRQPPPVTAKLEDFYAYLPKHSYIYTSTGQFWPPETINSIFGKGATVWLDRKKPLSSVTWCPGKPMVIPDHDVIESGWIGKKNAATFNLYKPPKPIAGDPHKAGPWVDLGKIMWGEEEADRIIRWLAFRVQHADIKINHSQFLGSQAQGIGKDSWLVPVKRAVGPWNFKDVAARQSLDPSHNSFLEATIVRISEVHDLGDKRQLFYDHSKDWMAAPPETLRVADKWIVAHAIFNVTGVIETGNHLTDGLYLPPDDRRHDVHWSDMQPEQFAKCDIWKWYTNENGIEHAAAYLATLDVTKYDPYAPPPKTDAFWTVVNACNVPEESDLAEVLHSFNVDPLNDQAPATPAEAITVDMVLRDLRRDQNAFGSELHELLTSHSPRAVPHKFNTAGYGIVKNPGRKDGLWHIDGKRVAIYSPNGMQSKHRLVAARKVAKSENHRAEVMRSKTTKLLGGTIRTPEFWESA